MNGIMLEAKWSDPCHPHITEENLRGCFSSFPAAAVTARVDLRGLLQIATAITDYSVYTLKIFSSIIIVQGTYQVILSIYEGFFTL